VRQSRLSNSSIFLLLGFGFGVAVLGVQQLVPNRPEFIAAAVYALIVAALAEFVGGLWAFLRGETYLGSIGTTFGVWLVGYYLMLTGGITAELYHPYSAAVYNFALVIPVALLMIPAVKFRLHLFTAIFLFLLLLLLFLGLANTPIAAATTMARLAGLSALVTALLLWWAAWGAIKGLMAEMGAEAPQVAPEAGGVVEEEAVFETEG
jgi:succinate-acetate transporter protein